MSLGSGEFQGKRTAISIENAVLIALCPRTIRSTFAIAPVSRPINFAKVILIRRGRAARRAPRAKRVRANAQKHDATRVRRTAVKEVKHGGRTNIFRAG